VGDRPVRWIALDAMGVLYELGGVTSLIARFARPLGATLPEVEIRALYREATEGRMDSAALWKALGIPGATRDAEFLEGRGLMPGARAFLESMDRAGIPAGCITNDLSEWSLRLRRAHGLEDAIAPWVVSAEVGVRKPARAIYEWFLERAGCDPAECLFVDDVVENLEGARSLGFQTAWFVRADGSPAAATGHTTVASFDEVRRLIAAAQQTSVF
jgi:HAD superfamily hydrolase (TIGR01509 family)